MLRWLGVVACLARGAVAATLVVVCSGDWDAARARADFAAIPEFDFPGEATRLLEERRYSEALLVVETGLLDADDAERPALERLHANVRKERDYWVNRLERAGQGALAGTGDSTEALVGAVVADLFVFGDLRDLVVQGGRYVRGQDADEILVALSTAGIVLTATPSLDLGTAALKFARRTGALTESFARSLARTARRAVETRQGDELFAVMDDASTLVRQAQPAPAMAILRSVDDAAELKLAARFSRRPGGTFALWLGGKSSMSALERGGEVGEELLLRAARKGRAGIDYLARNTGLLLRAHPLLGLAKGLYKGNVQDLLGELLRAYSQVLLGFFAGWLAFEAILAAARARRIWTAA